jgi:hypothetical protein
LGTRVTFLSFEIDGIIFFDSMIKYEFS